MHPPFFLPSIREKEQRALFIVMILQRFVQLRSLLGDISVLCDTYFIVTALETTFFLRKDRRPLALAQETYITSVA